MAGLMVNVYMSNTAIQDNGDSWQSVLCSPRCHQSHAYYISFTDVTKQHNIHTNKQPMYKSASLSSSSSS